MTKPYLSIPAMVAICLAALFMSGCDNSYVVVTPSIVDVRISEFGSNSVTAVLTPNESTSKFMFAIGNASELDSFKAGELDGTESREGNAQETHTFTGLEDGVTYTVFAAGYDEGGKLQAVQTILVTTTPVADSGIKINTQYAAAYVAACEVIASFDVAGYEWALYEGSVSEENRIDGAAVSEHYRYVYTFFDLSPETDYVFTVESTLRNRDVLQETVNFSTKKADEVPGVIFSIEYSDAYYGEFSVLPANGLTGAVATLHQDEGVVDYLIYDYSTGQGDLAGKIMEWAKIQNPFVVTHYSQQGGHTIVTTDPYLNVGVSREIYAVSCDLDGNIANVQKFSFINAEYDPTAGLAEVGIEVLNIQSNSVEYKYTMNSHTSGFFFQTFEAQAFEDEYLPYATDYPTYIHEVMSYYGTDYMKHPKVNSTMSWTDTTVEPGGEYYAVVAPFNANGASGWGKLSYTKFTTPQ